MKRRVGQLSDTEQTNEDIKLFFHQFLLVCMTEVGSEFRYGTRIEPRRDGRLEICRCQNERLHQRKNVHTVQSINHGESRQKQTSQ